MKVKNPNSFYFMISVVDYFFFLFQTNGLENSRQPAWQRRLLPLFQGLHCTCFHHAHMKRSGERQYYFYDVHDLWRKKCTAHKNILLHTNSTSVLVVWRKIHGRHQINEGGQAQHYTWCSIHTVPCYMRANNSWDSYYFIQLCITTKVCGHIDMQGHIFLLYLSEYWIKWNEMLVLKLYLVWDKVSSWFLPGGRHKIMRVKQ